SVVFTLRMSLPPRLRKAERSGLAASIMSESARSSFAYFARSTSSRLAVGSRTMRLRSTPKLLAGVGRSGSAFQFVADSLPVGQPGKVVHPFASANGYEIGPCTAFAARIWASERQDSPVSPPPLQRTAARGLAVTAGSKRRSQAL